MMTVGVAVSKKYGWRCMFANATFIDEHVEYIIS